jgi:outer membrane biosynthesis protein TonB
MSRLACLLLVALAVAASGCVTAQAKGEPGGPALAPPDPPPHTVIPVEIVEGPPAQPASDQPDAVMAKPPEAKPSKPAPKPAEKVPEKPPEVAPAPPAPPLQTKSNVTGVANEIDRMIRQAEANLSQVKEGALDDERRGQLNAAKQFLQEAKRALTEKNLEFARELANKAATLAEALARK